MVIIQHLIPYWCLLLRRNMVKWCLLTGVHNSNSCGAQADRVFFLVERHPGITVRLHLSKLDCIFHTYCLLLSCLSLTVGNYYFNVIITASTGTLLCFTIKTNRSTLWNSTLFWSIAHFINDVISFKLIQRKSHCRALKTKNNLILFINITSRIAILVKQSILLNTLRRSKWHLQRY